MISGTGWRETVRTGANKTFDPKPWPLLRIARRVLGGFLERGERFAPESIEPATKRVDAACVDRIKPPCALGAVQHDPLTSCETRPWRPCRSTAAAVAVQRCTT